MPDNLSKLRYLLCIVALAQILSIPLTIRQTAASLPASIVLEDGKDSENLENIWHGMPRKQRIKRARAARRAAVEACIMAQACKRAV